MVVSKLCDVLSFAKTFYDLGHLLKSYNIKSENLTFHGYSFDVTTYIPFFKKPVEVNENLCIMYTNWFGLLCKQSAFPDYYRFSIFKNRSDSIFVSVLSDYLVTLYAVAAHNFMDIDCTNNVRRNVFFKMDCFSLLSSSDSSVISSYDYSSLLISGIISDEFIVVLLSLFFNISSSVISFDKLTGSVCSNVGHLFVLGKSDIGGKSESYLGTVLLSLLCVSVRLIVPSANYVGIMGKLNKFRLLERKYLYMSFFHIILSFCDLDSVRFCISKSNISLNMFLGSTSEHSKTYDVSIYRNLLH